MYHFMDVLYTKGRYDFIRVTWFLLTVYSNPYFRFYNNDVYAWCDNGSN